MSGKRISGGLALAVGLALTVSPVCAQSGVLPKAKANKQNKFKQPKGPPLEPLPNPEVFRFLHMTPEEQRRELDTLPPDRRQQAEQRLRRYQALPADERERIDRRAELFFSLLPRRRQAIRDVIERMRVMTDGERRALLFSDAIKALYGPRELHLLREIAGYRDSE